VTDEDTVLVTRARNGAIRAFEELVDRHRAVVFRVAARVVGPHEADDVSQDALLRDLEGMAYEEIALITDSPLGSVKGRLRRARNELTEILRNNTYDWELPQ
jgi:DNA-directed RNA polymerase specialized sigma24 family protein